VTSPLSGSLARTIGSAFSWLFLDAVLSVDSVAGGGDPFDPPAPTTTTYACKAIVDDYSDYYRANGLVGAKDRKILILATSVAVLPRQGNRVTVGGDTFTIISVKTDPATAVWECQGGA
jgi:hypothetical protein